MTCTLWLCMNTFYTTSELSAFITSKIFQNILLLIHDTFNTSKVVRENSQYFAKSPLIFPQNDAWGMPAEIPYQRHVTTQISIVLLIGCAITEICFNQSEALPRSGYWRISAVTSLLGHHFVGKPVVATQYLGSFLSLYLRQ